MKFEKLLIIISIFLFSCDTPDLTGDKNYNLVYDTLPVSKLVDSIIKQTSNLTGNQANKNEVMYKILHNNFYIIYNNVPMKFVEMNDGTYISSVKKIYLTSFHNKFNTKDHNLLEVDVCVLMEEKDAKELMKDSLYVLTGDFKKWYNNYRGSISDYPGYYGINFPIVYLKNQKITNNKSMCVPFTIKKVTL